MIDRTHKLPVVRQCEILDLARSTAYYTAKPTSPEDLALMRRIDELHLDYPFAGSRMLRDLLHNEGRAVGLTCLIFSDHSFLENGLRFGG